MTRDRVTCNTIVHLLRDTNQTEMADKLKEFNTSSGPMPLSLKDKIDVDKRQFPIKDLSNCYNLVYNPRGKCIIINNLEDQQSPDVYNEKGMLVHSPKGLSCETLRFKHIFSELHFDVQVLTKLTSVQTRERLTQISKDPTLKDDAAFVLIFVSHGQNESVLGFNACEAIRKINFGEIRENDPEAIEEMERDVIEIKKIIDIFSDDNCPQLRSKPKLHFYICCRVKNSKTSGKLTR